MTKSLPGLSLLLLLLAIWGLGNPAVAQVTAQCSEPKGLTLLDFGSLQGAQPAGSSPSSLNQEPMAISK